MEALTVYARARRWVAVAWLLIAVAGTIASGQAWALAIAGFVVVTFLFLGLELIVKALLGKEIYNQTGRLFVRSGVQPRK